MNGNALPIAPLKQPASKLVKNSRMMISTAMSGSDSRRSADDTPAFEEKLAGDGIRVDGFHRGDKALI
jgi:hypothetical protein